MLASSASPRTSSVTRRALFERWTTACPAELPRADDIKLGVLERAAAPGRPVEHPGPDEPGRCRGR